MCTMYIHIVSSQQKRGEWIVYKDVHNYKRLRLSRLLIIFVD